MLDYTEARRMGANNYAVDRIFVIPTRQTRPIVITRAVKSIILKVHKRGPFPANGRMPCIKGFAEWVKGLILKQGYGTRGMRERE